MSKFFNTSAVSDSESWASDSESEKKDLKSDKKKLDSSSDSESDSDSESNKNTFKKKRAQTKKGKKALSNIKVNKDSDTDFKQELDDLDIPDFFEIHIRVKQRRGKKKITSIEGIPKKYLLDKDIANNLLLPLKEKLATRADRKKDKETDEYYIEVSGGDVSIIKEILIANIRECTDSNIKVHGI
jgi:translation initiation factor 1 (eIF-1/SUI1)